MRILATIFCLLFVGCGTLPQAHYDRIALARSRLPWTTPLAVTHSMSGSLNSGSTVTVIAKPYDELKSGDDAVFWPWGFRAPIAHRVGHRIGSDSWSTYGTLNPRDDLAGLGVILTRDIYIGSINRTRQ